MNNKFIRIISPITLFIILVMDIGVIIFGIYAVQMLMNEISTINVAFATIDVLSIILAGFVSREVVRNGAIFYPDKVEFTGIDNDNIFEYKNIESIETIKDNKASLKKNFVDRYSHIVLNMSDDTMVTISLGLTTNKTLKKIENELKSRIK